MAKKEDDKVTTEDKLLKRATDTFMRSKTWVEQEVQTDWADENDQYDGKFPNNQRKQSNVLLGQGRLFINKTYNVIQRMLVDILDTYFLDKEEIINVTSWKSVPLENREIVKALLNYRLNGHPIPFYQESLELCLDALRNKVGIFKVYPDFQDAKVSKGTKDTEVSLIEVEIDENGKKKKVTYRPVIETVPFEDIFFDPEATWKDYYKFPVVHRMKKSLDYLKKRGYKNLDKIPMQQSDSTASNEVKAQRSEDQGSPFNAPTKPGNLNMVFVYELWDFMDINNDGFLESVSYLAGGDEAGPQVIIRDAVENQLPYKGLEQDLNSNRCPFVMGQSFPEPHKLYGKSITEVLKDLQKETNAIRNQDREAAALGIRKPLMVQRGANIDLMSLVNRRIGGVVMGDDVSPSSVRELDIKPPTSSIQEQARTDQDIFEATSIGPPQFGGSTPGIDTATEVTATQANANKKISQAIRNLAVTAFIPASKMLLRMEQQYVTDDYVKLVTARVLGWQFSDDNFPAKNIIQGDFELTVNTSIAKRTQLNKWLLLWDRGNLQNQTIAQMVQTGVIDPSQAEFINLSKIFDQILPILGEKNTAEFKIQAQLPPPPQGSAPGIPSQARQVQSPEGQVGQANPEGLEGLVG